MSEKLTTISHVATIITDRGTPPPVSISHTGGGILIGISVVDVSREVVHV